MNDFTKEELTTILCGLSHLDEINPDSEALLASKVKSMIDNYCEHEWENTCCSCDLDRIYCHKCERDMGNLKSRHPRISDDNI